MTRSISSWRAFSGALEHHHGEDAGARGHVGGATGDGVGGHHPGARVALCRGERDPGPEPARRVKQAGALVGERSGALPGRQHGGEDVGQLPAVAPVRHQVVELGEHVCVELAGGGVDGEHAARVADAEGPLAREAPVHVAGQCGQVIDRADMLLRAEECLVEVRDAPPLRDVVLEQPREGVGRLARGGVLPGPEGHQQLTGRVEGHVAVHHGGETHRAHSLQRDAVAGLHIRRQVRVRGLQPRPDRVDVVGPESALELGLPLVATGGQRLVIRADEDGLDAGRAQLDAERRVATFDGVARGQVFHDVNLRCCTRTPSLPAQAGSATGGPKRGTRQPDETIHHGVLGCGGGPVWHP